MRRPNRPSERKPAAPRSSHRRRPDRLSERRPGAPRSSQRQLMRRRDRLTERQPAGGASVERAPGSPLGAPAGGASVERAPADAAPGSPLGAPACGASVERAPAVAAPDSPHGAPAGGGSVGRASADAHSVGPSVDGGVPIFSPEPAYRRRARSPTVSHNQSVQAPAPFQSERRSELGWRRCKARPRWRCVYLVFRV
jgi:hypothetical protein